MSSMEMPRMSIFLNTSFRSPEMNPSRCFSRMTFLAPGLTKYPMPRLLWMMPSVESSS